MIEQLLLALWQSFVGMSIILTTLLFLCWIIEKVEARTVFVLPKYVKKV